MMRVRFDSRWKYLAVDAHPFDVWLFTEKPLKDNNGNYYGGISSTGCRIGLHARNLYFETIYSLTLGTLYRIINDGTELEEVVERPDLEVDDPVVVKMKGDQSCWFNRHFAGWSADGRIMVYAYGATSFTTSDIHFFDDYKLPEDK